MVSSFVLSHLPHSNLFACAFFSSRHQEISCDFVKLFIKGVQLLTSELEGGSSSCGAVLSIRSVVPLVLVSGNFRLSSQNPCAYGASMARNINKTMCKAKKE